MAKMDQQNDVNGFASAHQKPYNNNKIALIILWLVLLLLLLLLYLAFVSDSWYHCRSLTGTCHKSFAFRWDNDNEIELKTEKPTQQQKTVAASKQKYKHTYTHREKFYLWCDFTQTLSTPKASSSTRLYAHSPIFLHNEFFTRQSISMGSFKCFQSDLSTLIRRWSVSKTEIYIHWTPDKKKKA